MRRAKETEDGVRDPVIDITHFCSNGIGAETMQETFARVATTFKFLMSYQLNALFVSVMSHYRGHSIEHFIYDLN